jgi:hypothetical protein
MFWLASVLGPRESIGFQVRLGSKRHRWTQHCQRQCPSPLDRDHGHVKSHMEESDYVESQFIPLVDNLDFGSEYGMSRRKGPDKWAILNFVIPTLTPILAYISYDELARGFDWLVDVASDNNWIAVDGGAYQAKVIAPAINGVVVPSIAILFATLTSTTISTLGARQVDIRRAINVEAGELRAIECLLEAFPHGNMKDKCRNYLIQYTSRIIAESTPSRDFSDSVVNPRRGMDSELNGFVNALNSRIDSNGDECAVEAAIPAYVLSEVFSSVSKLRDQRHSRITALQSTYPALHYIILIILALSTCIAFLMETDQGLLFFLNAVELKVLWRLVHFVSHHKSNLLFDCM